MKTTHSLINKTLSLTCLSVAIVLAGCGPENATESAEKKIDSASEMAEKAIDKSNEKAKQEIKGIESSLEKKAEQAKENIDQTTKASKEILEKSEDKADQAAEQAEEKVEQIKGASEKKIDEIKAATPDTTSETTGEYLDDSMITLKVKAAIMADPLLKASHINVNTVNGVVKLSGTVDSEKSMANAATAANSQKGVSAVQTDLTVDIKNK